MALKGICSMTLTLTDLFCGAGGSSTGAVRIDAYDQQETRS